MQTLFLVLMFVLGAVFGSFLCCQARRLRLKEKGKKVKKTRSVCLHCNKKIKWYDNVPILSWLFLGGECRYCHKKIGLAEIISELSLAIVFLSLGALFISMNDADFFSVEPMKWAVFVTALLFILSLAFLAIYDGLYGELPVFMLIIATIIAVILAVLEAWPEFTVMPILSAVLFGGIYLILYLVSKGQWVGDGDWILAGAIGLALGHPWLSMVALFISNLSACIIMYPVVKNKKNHQIYFGPFLVFAFVIVYVFSDFLISVI